MTEGNLMIKLHRRAGNEGKGLLVFVHDDTGKVYFESSIDMVKRIDEITRGLEEGNFDSFNSNKSDFQKLYDRNPYFTVHTYQCQDMREAKRRKSQFDVARTNSRYLVLGHN